MMQLDLVIPMARTTDPRTSHAAASRAASTAPTHRNIIMAALRDRPMTVKEIADATGLTQYAASKRLPELQRLGLAGPTGEEREGCRVWSALEP